MKRIIVLSLVSLSLLATNSWAEGQIEKSSPEEYRVRSLSDPYPLNGGFRPVDYDVVVDGLESKNISGVSPLLTAGVFPYQINPIYSIAAAAITLGVMSLKETGQVNLEGIGYLLNSTDFYAGIAGIAVQGYSQKGAAAFVKYLAKSAANASPDTLAPLLNKSAVKAFGNALNGISYTVAVSTGYETFSQFWKIATKNIPEAQKVSEIGKWTKPVFNRVLGNLMYYVMYDKNMQKRILDSVYKHRIMTFEFISMNIALYVGMQLGSYLTARYAPNHPIWKRLGPVLGGIGLGFIVQLIPNSWKAAANYKLLERKIASESKNVNQLAEMIRAGVQDRSYTPRDAMGFASYLSGGVDLANDVERLFRSRDMLASLELQKIVAGKADAIDWNLFVSNYDIVYSTLSGLEQALSEWSSLSTNQHLEDMIAAGRSPSEIVSLSQRWQRSDPHRLHYLMVLTAGAERAKEGLEEARGLLRILEQRYRVTDDQKQAQ